jgi:hypothetical protein
VKYHDWVDQARSFVKYHAWVDQVRSLVNRKSKTYIAIPAEVLGIILPLILEVAFLVLAEHKVMAFVQHRKGPYGKVPDVLGTIEGSNLLSLFWIND